MNRHATSLPLRLGELSMVAPRHPECRLLAIRCAFEQESYERREQK